MRYVYTGNVRDPEGESTWCHECGGLLIARRGFRIGKWNLTEDACCVRCKAPVAGRFEGPAGDWGARYLPVRLRDWETKSALGAR